MAYHIARREDGVAFLVGALVSELSYRGKFAPSLPLISLHKTIRTPTPKLTGDKVLSGVPLCFVVAQLEYPHVIPKEPPGVVKV